MLAVVLVLVFGVGVVDVGVTTAITAIYCSRITACVSVVVLVLNCILE